MLKFYFFGIHLSLKLYEDAQFFQNRSLACVGDFLDFFPAPSSEKAPLLTSSDFLFFWYSYRCSVRWPALVLQRSKVLDPRAHCKIDDGDFVLKP